MPGCVRIAGSLQTTIETAVLIKTLKDLISDLRWFSCNIFSNQDQTVAFITNDESTAVFSWKGNSIEETGTAS